MKCMQQQSIKDKYYLNGVLLLYEEVLMVYL